MDGQLKVCDVITLVVSLNCSVLCLLVFKLYDATSLWRRYPHKLLVWYTAACGLRDAVLLLMEGLASICNDWVTCTSVYCDVQRFLLTGLMLMFMPRLEWVARQSKLLWISVVAPLPFCFWVPSPTTMRGCLLGGGELNGFYLVLGTAYFVILFLLAAVGLCRDRPVAAPGLMSELPAPGVSANALIEFEPDSPTCYQHYGAPRATLPTVPSMTQLDFGQADADASEMQMPPTPSSWSDPGFRTLQFAILIIAAKRIVAVTICTVIRAIFFLQPDFETDVEPSLAYGLLVELLLENSEGVSMLLIIVSLFETPFSSVSQNLRRFHRESRSRSSSVPSSFQP